MMEENENLIRENPRPFFLSILCVAVFVYSVVFILIFSALAVFSNWFKIVLTDFLPELEIERSRIIWFAITGIVFYSLAFVGAYLMWKLKRTGFYIYVVASALISAVPYLFGLGGITNVIVFSLLTAAFMFFFKILDQVVNDKIIYLILIKVKEDVNEKKSVDFGVLKLI